MHVRIAATYVALAYFYGLLLGGVSLAWEVLFRDGLPSLDWWQRLLAPLGIGGAAMVAEWLFQKLQGSTGFGSHGHSRFKRAVHLFILFAVLASLIIGPALYKVANP